MFYQVRISPHHRNWLRFFWFKGPKIKEYRLKVHVFGAVSSPAVANYALKQTISDHPQYSEDVKTAVMKNFYADDLLFTQRTHPKMKPKFCSK